VTDRDAQVARRLRAAREDRERAAPTVATVLGLQALQIHDGHVFHLCLRSVQQGQIAMQCELVADSHAQVARRLRAAREDRERAAPTVATVLGFQALQIHDGHVFHLCLRSVQQGQIAMQCELVTDRDAQVARRLRAAREDREGAAPTVATVLGFQALQIHDGHVFHLCFNQYNEDKLLCSAN